MRHAQHLCIFFGGCRLRSWLLGPDASNHKHESSKLSAIWFIDILPVDISPVLVSRFLTMDSLPSLASERVREHQSTLSCQVRSSSSALRALSSLTPPSPILTPAQICATFTSGEIPILFESTSITSITSSSSSSTDEGMFSTDTLDTMGTFGPKRSYQAGLQWTSKSCGFSATRETTNGAPPLVYSADPLIPSGSMPSIRARLEPLSIVSAFAALPDNVSGVGTAVECPWPQSSPTFRAAVSSLNNASLDNHGAPYEHEVNEGTCEQILRYLPTSQTFSTLPTPSFAPPSPSPSADLAFSSPSLPRRRKLCSNAAYLTPHQDDESVLQDHASLASSSPMMSGPRLPIHFPSPDLVRQPAPLSTSSDQQQPPTHQKYGFLPEKLSWLKGFAVELLIDQEGFRAIQPSLKLMGYSTHSRFWSHHPNSHSEDSVLGDSLIEFMPAKRQSFNFHYAPFDGLPTLRRITVNGDETRDYISRQASLSLKSNGVYTVRGTETSLLPACVTGQGNYCSDPAKLKWKFDYMVDDRRVDSTGQIMVGEKTLTPLTFACSPDLLNSIQGKKIGLMHVVRKSVIPNLAAEKMEPPRHFLRKGPSMSNLKATIQNTTSHYFAKSQAWNRHRRARSNVVHHEDGEALITKSPARPGTKHLAVHLSNKLPDYQLNKQHARRRRASSAGERTWGNPMVTIENIVPNLPTVKHIVPPAHLCALLSTSTEGMAHAVPRHRHRFEALSSPKSRSHQSDENF
jgi:hypothetical protein